MPFSEKTANTKLMDLDEAISDRTRVRAAIQRISAGFTHVSTDEGKPIKFAAIVFKDGADGKEFLPIPGLTPQSSSKALEFYSALHNLFNEELVKADNKVQEAKEALKQYIDSQ